MKKFLYPSLIVLLFLLAACNVDQQANLPVNTEQDNEQNQVQENESNQNLEQNSNDELIHIETASTGPIATLEVHYIDACQGDSTLIQRNRGCSSQANRGTGDYLL